VEAHDVRQERVTVTATVTKTATAIVTDETTGWNAALACKARMLVSQPIETEMRHLALATASVITASWRSVLSEASVFMAKASSLSSELDQASRDAANATSG
jgi:transcriptional regulator of nitric oxide reductase